MSNTLCPTEETQRLAREFSKVSTISRPEAVILIDIFQDLFGRMPTIEELRILHDTAAQYSTCVPAHMAHQIEAWHRIVTPTENAAAELERLGIKMKETDA